MATIIVECSCGKIFTMKAGSVKKCPRCGKPVVAHKKPSK